MAILGKNEILNYIKEGKLSFDPVIDKFQVQPNSIDLRCGFTFYVPEQWQMSDEGRVITRPDYLKHNANANNFRMLKLKPGQYFEFLPHEFVIVSSFEKIALKADNLMALLYPRSSMIRRGLVIESGVVDLHYQGNLTIPIFNGTNQPLRLYPGERVYQLVFHTLEGGLSHDEAQLHGAVKAKYEGATSANLESRTDSDDELEFIRQGKLTDIKEKYKI
jgi:dCTP deaminase